MKPDEDPHLAIKAKTGPRLRAGYNQTRNRGTANSSNTFHVMSRFVKEVEFMDDVEKEGLMLLMQKMAAFLGVDLLTFCVMGNHFHALVEVPERQSWLEWQFGGKDGEERFLRHLGTFYSRAFMMGLRADLAMDREHGDEKRAQGRLEEFRRRCCDVSVWTKEVKERFSRWMNKRRGRKGTLWMGRFRSKLVLGGNMRLMTAVYIDLNSVRAEMVAEPKDYRWCGYAQALGGTAKAQEGLCTIMGLRHWVSPNTERWPSTRTHYRRALYGQGQERFDWRGELSRAGFSAARVKAVLEKIDSDVSLRGVMMQRVALL
jgi:putative transposase